MSYHTKLFLSIFMVLTTKLVYPTTIDSLQNVCNSCNTDTCKISAYYKIGLAYYIKRNPDKIFEVASKSSSLLKNYNIDDPTIKTHILNVYYLNGIAFFLNNNFDSALTCYSKAEALLASTINNDHSKILLYRSIASSYKWKDEFEKSLYYDLKSLKIAEDIHDSLSMAISYSNIGETHGSLKNYSLAIYYLKKSIDICNHIPNAKYNIGFSYCNLASIYELSGQYDKAIYYYRISLNIRKQINDSSGIANCTLGIGNIYYYMAESVNTEQETRRLYFKSINNYVYALEIFKSKKNLLGQSIILSNIGDVYNNLKEYKLSIKYTLESNKIAESIKQVATMQNNYERLIYSYAGIDGNNHISKYLKLYIQIKDSILDTEKSKQLIEIQTKYETEKKDQELMLSNAQNNINQEHIKSQHIKIIFFCVGLGLLVLLLIVTYKNYFITKRSKNDIAKQKHIIEEKNKEITDNITYAKRIQDAVITPIWKVKELFNNSFIFNSPKDIVSGDFYWASSIGENKYIAVADCTNHGVSGAMMTLLCNNLLNDALKSGIQEPSKILDYINTYLGVNLHQTGQEKTVKDGMDISLCCINISTMEIQFSGAYNPLILIRDNKPIEIDADKLQIGQAVTGYKNNVIRLQSGDMIYLSTDGFSDQFGGEKGKKYKYRNLINLLCRIANSDISNQYETIKNTFDTWKGLLEQTDDVLLMGIKI